MLSLESATGEQIDSEEEPTPKRRGTEVRSWVVSLGVALLLAFTVRATIVESFVIPSPSMAQTLQIDDRILVQRTMFDLNGINRGDVIVFDRPAAADPTAPDVFIKRVIAVGGDRVAATGGVVSVNDTPLTESYVLGTTTSFGPITLAGDELFVMGDNRLNSTDSRVFGPIPASSVIGSAFAKTWPLNRLGFVS